MPKYPAVHQSRVREAAEKAPSDARTENARSAKRRAIVEGRSERLRIPIVLEYSSHEKSIAPIAQRQFPRAKPRAQHAAQKSAGERKIARGKQPKVKITRGSARTDAA